MTAALPENENGDGALLFYFFSFIVATDPIILHVNFRIAVQFTQSLILPILLSCINRY